MPKRTDIQKILVIGSGPIVIGQACEFDYSGTQACKVLRSEGYTIVLVNSNPATIMTDPELADCTYIEPLTPEYLEKIILEEKPDNLLVLPLLLHPEKMLQYQKEAVEYSLFLAIFQTFSYLQQDQLILAKFQ